MRRWIAAAGLLLVAAVAALGGAGIGLAQDPATPAATPRTLEVTGRGTVNVTPDTAVISVGTSMLENTPSEAYAAASKAMNKMAAALKAMGVDEKDIKTTQLNLNAEYNWTQERGQQLKGYRAFSTLTVSTQKLDQVGALVDAAIAAGANQLNSINFTVKDPQKLLEQAMDAAVDNAMEKANRVAARMNTTVVSVLKVMVMDGSGTVVYSEAARAGKGGAADAMPIFSGSSDYTATVSATFEIK